MADNATPSGPKSHADHRRTADLQYVCEIVRSRIGSLPWGLPLFYLSDALCQLIAGCRPTISPHCEPASEGIKPQSDVIPVAIEPHGPQTLFMGAYEPGGGLPTGVMSGRRLAQALCKQDGREFHTTGA